MTYPLSDVVAAMHEARRIELQDSADVSDAALQAAMFKVLNRVAARFPCITCGELHQALDCVMYDLEDAVATAVIDKSEMQKEMLKRSPYLKK